MLSSTAGDFVKLVQKHRPAAIDRHQALARDLKTVLGPRREKLLEDQQRRNAPVEFQNVIYYPYPYQVPARYCRIGSQTLLDAVRELCTPETESLNIFEFNDMMWCLGLSRAGGFYEVFTPAGDYTAPFRAVFAALDELGGVA
jgi:hypothetical protein